MKKKRTGMVKIEVLYPFFDGKNGNFSTGQVRWIPLTDLNRYGHRVKVIERPDD